MTGGERESERAREKGRERGSTGKQERESQVGR